MITRWQRIAWSVLLAGLCLLGGARPVRADFLAGYSGNTTESNAGSTRTIDGTYNFAVLDRLTGGYTQYDSQGHEIGNVFGAVSDPSKPYDPNNPNNGRFAANFDGKFNPGVGSGGLDTSARYLYLVQVVNNGPTPTPIKQVSTYLDPTLVTSWGVFGPDGLNDNRGAVDFNNNFGSNGPGDPKSPPDSGFQFNAPANAGVLKPGVVNVTGGTDPGIVPATVSLGADNLLATFAGSGLAAGQRSVLIAFTSNDAPGLTGIDQMFDLGGGNFSQGHNPIPAPEPSSLVLVGCGLAGLGLLCFRRRRLAATPAV
jgi:hypothetical protein